MYVHSTVQISKFLHCLLETRPWAKGKEQIGEIYLNISSRGSKQPMLLFDLSL